MQHLTALDPKTTTGKSKELFNAIENKLGMVPNMMRTMGNSSSVLNGYLNFSGSLAEGVLGAKTGELIALTVANANTCDYCNAAHSLIGEKLVHIDTTEIAEAREGKSNNAKIQGALTFALKLVLKKGEVSAQDVASVKLAGYDDAGIGEPLSHIRRTFFVLDRLPRSQRWVSLQNFGRQKNKGQLAFFSVDNLQSANKIWASLYR